MASVSPPRHAYDVEHEPERKRFVIRVEGDEALLEYRLRGRRLTITHTEVPEHLGGRGIAAALTTAALRFVREGRLKVVPQCAYAAAFMERHTEYTDLLV